MGLCARFLLGSWLGSWLGCVGVVGVLGFALFDVFLGGMGCWIAGIRGWGVCFVGVCFGSGISILGLHIIYVMNVTSLILLG